MRLRLGCIALLLSGSLSAAVTKIHLVERADVLDGKAFGAAGPYERIVAKAYFAVDPKLPANRLIRDIDLAPKNADGMVEFSADLYVLKPLQPANGNGTILYEVSNRGGKGLLPTFNYAASSNDPRTDAEFGDGFLLAQGYTLIWLGWQFDVPKGLLSITVPLAMGVSGIVRSEYVPSAKGTRMELSERNMKAYPVSDPEAPGTQLNVRDVPDGPRRVIPRAQWKFAGDTAVDYAAGFVPGKLYEVIYTSKNPEVAGLGLAATRDLISFLKYTNDSTILLGDQSRVLKRAISTGSSQSGRFLRTFLHQGFNADEKGKRVFDGVWPQIAGGGRGGFNQRFAQPSRTNGRMSPTQYPVDQFPFADLRMMDSETKEVDGLLTMTVEQHASPKIFYTNGAHEYWGRAASLIHTTPDGKKDDGLGPDTRAYFVAGTPHGSGRWPSRKTAGQAYPANPNDYRPVMRALLGHLLAWVKEDKLPPASRVPRVEKGELISPAQLHFPALPGVQMPKAPNVPVRMNFGPEFADNGVISIDPPKLGKPYGLLIPQVDRDGNETAGIRMPDVSVPLGTYTGWNLRDASIGSPTEMFSLAGSFHAFAATKKDREAKKDPRPSIEERYPTQEEFLARTKAAIEALVADGFILAEDKSRLEKQAADRWAALAGK